MSISDLALNTTAAANKAQLAKRGHQSHFCSRLMHNIEMAAHKIAVVDANDTVRAKRKWMK